MTGEYISVDTYCRHCNGKMKARYVCDGPELEGLFNLRFIHEKSGKSECFVRHEAEPYNGWTATRDYKKAIDQQESGGKRQ